MRSRRRPGLSAETGNTVDGGARGKPVDVAINIGLLLVSSLSFALSFPSFVSIWGWFPLAFVCLIPVFVVVHRSGWALVPLYGAFYGFVSYALFNFWLAQFHPLAIIIVPIIYLAYFIVLFPALKAADSLFPRYGYVLQAFVWMSYEYLRTLGFIGYSYGVLGYSQYLFLPLSRVSALTGVWGVTFLLVFPQALFGNALARGRAAFRRFFADHRFEAAAFGVLFGTALVYGFASERDLSGARQWRVALVQQNVDPWHGEYEAYRNSLDILKRQSLAALEEDPEIVMWSETSFVPGIDWHTRFRSDPMRYELVKELREFLSDKDVPFVIGNDDGQYERRRDGTFGRVDYNATLVYEDGRLKQTYRKTHLVPFTEHFPFEKQLPGIYAWLEAADTHFWEKGTEYTVFDAAGVKFSTPICFEDTFGYLSRRFIREGAEVIVNIGNDSWSGSVAAMMQHMGMAVFRALENRRTVVRSTNGGITGTIDPNGRITSMLDPFTEGYLVTTVPVYTAEETLYTRWGDWLALTFLVLSCAGLLFGLGLRLRRYGIDKSREV